MMKLLNGSAVVAQAENIVYDNTVRGWRVGDAVYSDGDKAYTLVDADQKPPKVTVIEYKMLFTSTERIAVKASTDPVIIDLQELMNDPRTVNVDLSLQSISDALDYMTALGLIAPGRKAEILTGQVR
jgi:hypothetical protein